MNRKVKMLAMALSLAMTASTATAVFAAEKPADIKGSIYENAITELFENGIVTGDTDGSFYPESNLTRAQACIMLVKAIDPKSDLINGTATQGVYKSTDFSDMSGYAWVEKYVSYAVQQGIVKGYPDGTFKPAEKVTTNEMLTMVLRASGYTDEKVGGVWPEAHIQKAEEIGLLENLEENYPETATKGMAAQMISNQLEALRETAPDVEDKPQGTEEDKASELPYTSDMQYAQGSFSSDMTAFAGKSISKQVEVYTYGLKNEYSEAMIMSSNAEDYTETNVYRYKSTKTPIWYSMEGNKIVKIILPSNVGFTGNVYCVINDIMQTMNGEAEAVDGVETLTAAKKVTWLGKSGLDLTTYNSHSAGDGQVFELKVVDGVIKNIADHTNAKGKKFTELTAGWTNIDDYDNTVVRVGAALFQVKDNASVYVWDESKDEYKTGTLSSIRAGKDIRAYDVSDDDETSADVVVVKK